MRILVWHVHGGWMDAFVRGPHEYLVPVVGGAGGAGGRDWPAVTEVTPSELAAAEVDAVVLQRLEELELAERWLGRRLGRDVPAFFVEHNTPRGDVPGTVHPLADRDDVTIVHVTHFNALMWDAGRTRTRVIEHGIPDPGARYSGELERIGVVINEPVRRARVAGTDLLPRFARRAPVALYGIACELVPSRFPEHADRFVVRGDLPTWRLHADLAANRVYLHPFRWTSLGLTLLEAMALGMPVAALATTEAPRAVPREAGIVSNDLAELERGIDLLLRDPEEARRRGRVAREAALERYGLARFLADWDDVLSDGAAGRPVPVADVSEDVPQEVPERRAS